MSKQLVVLLIAPDGLTRALATDGLASYGFRVIAVPDGAAALDQLKTSQAIDVLVTDAELKGEVDGLTLARTARQLRPRIDVIYSARVPSRIPDPAKVPGAPCLRSPYHPYQLVSVIGALKHRLSSVDEAA